MDAGFEFAKNAVTVRYEDIPAEALKGTKADVLDTLGTALAGSAAAGGREIVSLVKEWDGRKESTIVGDGSKVLAIGAALANGSMAHALDYDDTHEKAHLHAGVSTIPAALAVAERVGGVNGKEFLTAVTLGLDMTCRMGLANPKGPGKWVGWMLTPLYGFFGATVAAGKLVGLTEEEMVNALGIAYSQASGNEQCVLDGALTKRMQLGFAAKGGILAALMAQKGITGAKESLQGRMGIYHTYHQDEYHPNALTEELGKRFESANLSFKPYPCCRFSHAHIDAALALAKQHEISPDEVESITAFVDRWPHVLCDPLDIKRNPRTIVDAQFSIPYTVATALVKRGVKIGDFTLTAIKDPVVVGLANKVTPVLDATLSGQEPAAAALEIKTKRGSFRHQTGYPYGHPANPMSDEALAQKFRDCAAHAAKALPEANITGLISMIGRLEDLTDMAEVTRLLT
ncbi:MAG: MmgE/PrpD family protein [Chloroflexota bacterium]